VRRGAIVGSFWLSSLRSTKHSFVIMIIAPGAEHEAESYMQRRMVRPAAPITLRGDGFYPRRPSAKPHTPSSKGGSAVARGGDRFAGDMLW
jgi:hypothetical protein